MKENEIERYQVMRADYINTETNSLHFLHIVVNIHVKLMAKCWTTYNYSINLNLLKRAWSPAQAIEHNYRVIHQPRAGMYWWLGSVYGNYSNSVSVWTRRNNGSVRTDWYARLTGQSLPMRELCTSSIEHIMDFIKF